MKALIDTETSLGITWITSWTWNEDTQEYNPVFSEVNDAQRVAEVVADDATFEVYQTLIWVDCADDCVADEWYYKDGACYINPPDVPEPANPPE
jgi:hypothetical protein